MEIKQSVWEVIETEIYGTGHGTVTLIVQDGRLLQVDTAKKIRLSPDSQLKTRAEQPDEALRKKLRPRISQVLQGLKFGQIVICVKDNKVSQIERLEKHRLNDLQGLYGEGI